MIQKTLETVQIVFAMWKNFLIAIWRIGKNEWHAVRVAKMEQSKIKA